MEFLFFADYTHLWKDNGNRSELPTDNIGSILHYLSNIGNRLRKILTFWDENGETIPETTVQSVEDEVIPYEDGLGIPDRMPGMGAMEPAPSSGAESSAASEPEETASEEETQ